MAGNLAAISAIRPVKIRTVEIAIRPAARILAQSSLRNDNYANHGGYHGKPDLKIYDGLLTGSLSGSGVCG